MEVVGEALVLLLFGRNLMGRTLLFKAALMYYHTTNHFQTLTRRGSCHLFKNSNTIFKQLTLSPMHLQNHLYLLPLINFPTSNVIFLNLLHNSSKDSLISHSFLTFTLVFILIICSLVVLELVLKRGIRLIRRTS